MAEFPGFTIWTDAYLADTGHLSTLEHGAYLLLLIAMWRAGGALPNDDARLARFARMNDAQWAKIKPTMMEFFKVLGGEITQGRLQDEMEKARNRSSRASENARAKYRKTLKTDPAPAVPEASQNDSSISISIDTVKTKPSVSKKPAEKTPRQELEEVINPDMAEAVIEHRQRIRKPLTGRAAKGLAAKFAVCRDPNAAAEAMIVNGWQGFDPAWLERSRGSPGPGKSDFRKHQDEVTAAFEKDLGFDKRSHAYDDGKPAFDLDRSAYGSDRTRKNRE